jgi:hypothetical protein
MAQVIRRVFLNRAMMPVFLAIALGFSPRASRAADGALEYGVKATFLLRFAQFVEWPPDALGAPDSPFNICVLGNNPFGNTLDRIVSGESVYGHKVATRRTDHEPAAGSCQVIFFGDEDQVARTLTGLGRGVLTVGEGEDFVRNGGMIGFVIENRRVTFDINRGAAEAAGLKLRSGLLSVARSVIK